MGTVRRGSLSTKSSPFPTPMHLSKAATALSILLVSIGVFSYVITPSYDASLQKTAAIRGNMAGVRPCMGRMGAMRGMRADAKIGFINMDADPSTLISDLREGETAEMEGLRQPATWDEYKLFLAETEGPQTAPVQTTYGLNVLWLEKNIALAVDEIYPGNQRIPLTTFHLWPQTDAWEDIKSLLETKSWVQERDVINVLNQATEVINFWQEEKTTADAREKFPELLIHGTEQHEGATMDADTVDSLMSADGAENVIDTSAIPRITLKQAPGFEELFSEKAWYRDPEAEGPWDPNSGVWKDVSIKTLEDLQASVPQKMPGQK